MPLHASLSARWPSLVSTRVVSSLSTTRSRFRELPTTRMPLLASAPAHWLSRASTCVAFRIACSTRSIVRGRDHTHIKPASTGIHTRGVTNVVFHPQVSTPSTMPAAMQPLVLLSTMARLRKRRSKESGNSERHCANDDKRMKR